MGAGKNQRVSNPYEKIYNFRPEELTTKISESKLELRGSPA
jgi:hypothetical protein